MILLDTSVLSYLLYPDSPAPLDPSTGKPVTDTALRIEHFIATHQRGKIVVAMPSLAELLVKAGERMDEFLARFEKSNAFQLKPFDKAAAVETALMEQEAIATGDKKGGGDAAWAKVKVDRQILAIGRVAGVVDFYSDDTNMRKMAARLQIDVKGIADMPLQPSAAQHNLDL
jgi:predicted nucleic acid-binding protein